MHFKKSLQIPALLALISFCLMTGCQDQPITTSQNEPEQPADISYSDTEVDELIDQVSESLRNSLQTLPAIQKDPANISLQKKSSAGFVRIDDEINGILYSMIKPDPWNGDLVLLMHGSLPDLFDELAQQLSGMGFGVAGIGIGKTTITNSDAGSAIKDVTLTTRVIEANFNQLGKVEQTYFLSFSRGSGNAHKLLETSPSQYNGHMAVCGGAGATIGFSHFFTSRILFDYFFPGNLPGSALKVPAITLDEYIANHVPNIVSEIISNPDAAFEMASVDQYHLDFKNFNELITGIASSLAIHTIGVNDLLDTANGNPFDNSDTIYNGTSEDEKLNNNIVRLESEPQAVNYLNAWSMPEGKIDGTPVLLLHTTRDPLVPERLHNDFYENLIIETGNTDSFLRRRVDRFGHCTFTTQEILDNFTDLTQWVETGLKPAE